MSVFFDSSHSKPPKAVWAGLGVVVDRPGTLFKASQSAVFGPYNVLAGTCLSRLDGQHRLKGYEVFFGELLTFLDATSLGCQRQNFGWFFFNFGTESCIIIYFLVLT